MDLLKSLLGFKFQNSVLKRTRIGLCLPSRVRKRKLPRKQKSIGEVTVWKKIRAMETNTIASSKKNAE